MEGMSQHVLVCPAITQIDRQDPDWTPLSTTLTSSRTTHTHTHTHTHMSRHARSSYSTRPSPLPPHRPIAVPIDRWFIWPPPMGHPLFAIAPAILPLVFKFYDSLSGFSCPPSHVMSNARASRKFPQLDKRTKYVKASLMSTRDLSSMMDRCWHMKRRGAGMVRVMGTWDCMGVWVGRLCVLFVLVCVLCCLYYVCW